MSKKQKTIEELLEEALVPEEEHPYELPDNWTWVNLKSSLNSIQYGYTETSSFQEIGPKFLRITDIQDDNVNWESVPYCKITEKELHKYELKNNDIVVARTGATTGKSYLISEPPMSVFASYLIRLRCKDIMFPKYLWEFMKSPVYWKQIMVVKKGSAQPGANAQILGDLSVPLPPLNEQKRIAEKVERLLSKIEEAKQLIEEAKQTFDLRRAAILDKALRGELTRKWRIHNCSTGDDIQILQEIQSKITNKKLKQKNLDENNFYELPDNWAWVRLGEISNVKSSKRIFASEYTKSGIPFYRSKEIGELSFLGKTTSELFISEERYAEIKEKFGIPKTGDILLTSVGTIGNTWICDGREFYYKDGNITQIEKNEYVNTEFIQLFLKSYLFKKQVSLTVSGSAYNALTIEKINELVIPFPPLKEQQEIVRTTKNVLNMEEESRNILYLEEKINGLAQSILSKAFRGELGTNDPSEESAIELLKEVLQEQVK